MEIFVAKLSSSRTKPHLQAPSSDVEGIRELVPEIKSLKWSWAQKSHPQEGNDHNLKKGQPRQFLSCARGVSTPPAYDGGRCDLCPVQGGCPPPLRKTNCATDFLPFQEFLSCARGVSTPPAYDGGRSDLCPMQGGCPPPLRKTGISLCLKNSIRTYMPRQRERQEANPTRPSSKSELAALHLRLRSRHLPAEKQPCNTKEDLGRLSKVAHTLLKSFAITPFAVDAPKLWRGLAASLPYLELVATARLL